MPRIIRWFPVSHDINADAEVWAMRKQIGEKALSVWLEILSIADRNDSLLSGDYQELVRSIAGRCQATTRTVIAVFDFALSRLWLDSQPTLRVAKHWKYHRLQEQNKTPTGNRKSSLPSLTTLPNLDSKDTDDPPPDSNVISIQDFVESWNEQFAGKLPQVDWPVSQSRRSKIKARLREHPEVDFWETVYTNIMHSPFLLGSHTGNGGHENWKCTLDFLIANDTNAIKIKEGVYDKAQR